VSKDSTETPRRIIPAKAIEHEITVVNSQFITNMKPAFSIDEARDFVKEIKEKYKDASHNVPVFIIGHGASITEHCSDDGEPEGTAGRPALAVLKGSGMGDVVAVITRYFGGTKLGTGGLVRAYSDSIRQTLTHMPRAEKIATQTLGLTIPYNGYERVKLFIEEYEGNLLEEDFGADVSLIIQFRSEDTQTFSDTIKNFFRGQIETVLLEENENSIFPISA
jgi:uncharacterized YigZ family protein